MLELISDCGHYVVVRSGVVECLLKRVSIDCALDAWNTRVVLLDQERRLELMILTSSDKDPMFYVFWTRLLTVFIL